MIDVSIVVPVYNAEKYLDKCIESLVNQTLDNYEIIFVNDGSTDTSRDILEKYQETYPDIIKIINKDNGGQASARNLGIDCSQGTYIGFIDADDYAEYQMFEKLLEAANMNQADVSECNYYFLRYENDQRLDMRPYCTTRQYKSNRDMFIDPLVSPWNKLFRADLLNESKVRFVEGCIYEDTGFYIKLIPFIKKQVYVDEALIHHVFWESSTMNANRNLKVGDIFTVLEDVYAFYKANYLWDEYYEELEYFSVKILLNSSLGRIFQIKDRTLRKSFQDRTLSVIAYYFADYHKNQYLKKSKKAVVIKSMNALTIPLYGWVYRRIMRKGYFIG